MGKRRWIFGGAILASVVAMLSCIAAWAGIFPWQAEGWPGGFTSTYAAADGDMRLTAEASTAVPIAKAVKTYFAKHSTFPSMTELQSLLKSSPVSSSRGGQINGWSYFPDSDKRGFSLTRKLGWDTALRYSWDGTSDEWFFEPGDASASKKIDLRP